MKLKLKRVLAIPFLPIAIILGVMYFIITAIIKATSGKRLYQEDLDNLAKNIFTNLKSDIMNHLELDTLPTIGCNNSIKRGLAGRHITIKSSHPYDAYEEQLNISRSHIFESEDWYDGNLVHYEAIYPCVIYERSSNNIFIYQFVFISTIVHELAHYKQHLLGTVEPNYIKYNADNYREYKKQFMERDADASARKFIVKNIFTIIKIIYKNSRRYK